MGGFTLVELLVALSLLAMIALIGVAMLRVSIDSQARIAARVDDISRLDRLHAIMTQDFSQAVGRNRRGFDGASIAAFVGSTRAVALVRIGRVPLANSSASTVESLVYRFAEQGWWRSATRADGHVAGTGDVLQGELRDVRLSYRGAAGVWFDSWDSQEYNVRLPHAVRVVFTPLDGAPLEFLFLIGPQPWPAAVAAREERP